MTEFSWDSKPPDPDALAATLHRRWVAEALYRMWVDGVSLVTWFRFEDDPLTGPGSTPYQSGFWTTGGAAEAVARGVPLPGRRAHPEEGHPRLGPDTAQLER